MNIRHLLTALICTFFLVGTVACGDIDAPDDTTEETSALASCPEANSSGDDDEACIQVLACCEHQATGQQCVYPTPCDVPQGFEASEAWDCSAC